MGSSVALVCSTAFVLVLLSSASKDDHNLEQREVTFDIDRIMQERQQPDSLVLQKEVDLADLFDPTDFIEQVIVSPPEQIDILNETGGSIPGGLTPRGRRPSFGPRSFGGPPILDYPVQFPLGQPTNDNLQAICNHGDRRPTYPDSYFPDSGFGQQKRRASAVNRAESWFSTCCKGTQTWGREATLCCATQAWELSVNSFCTEDSAVKDRLYACCRMDAGRERLKCFHKDAPNPNYEATEELPVPPVPSTINFEFDPSTCARTVMTPYGVSGNRRKKEKDPFASKKLNMNFPPGRPTADNIESLCRDQKLRPTFKINCHPGEGFEYVAHQARAINRIEKGYKQCCKKKKGVVGCADMKWRQELNKYCVPMRGKEVNIYCCMSDTPEGVFRCFQNIAVDKDYNSTSAKEELSLTNICDTHKIIKKKFPVGFPLKTFVSQCCPEDGFDKIFCFQRKVQEMSMMCLTQKGAPQAIRHCCPMAEKETEQCITDILMDAITKATTVLRQKKKKRCPFS